MVPPAIVSAGPRGSSRLPHRSDVDGSRSLGVCCSVPALDKCFVSGRRSPAHACSARIVRRLWGSHFATKPLTPGSVSPARPRCISLATRPPKPRPSVRLHAARDERPVNDIGDRLWAHAEAVRRASPLVHNITNYVVMNTSANSLLAVGASPIMSHARVEMEQLTEISASLVVNIGTLDEYKVESMIIATSWMTERGKPWVLDPVGAGATAYRDEVLDVLVDNKPAVIRGNGSEIMALARVSGVVTKGVDSTVASDAAVEAGKWLVEKYGCVVCVSGKTDVIVGKDRVLYLSNGDVMMTRVTGLGCCLSAVTGAFVGVVEDHFEAAAAAAAVFSVAGELAAKKSPGPGTLQVMILDKLYTLEKEEFLETLRVQ